MPIYKNDHYQMMVIGDFHPVKVMDGNQTIIRALESEKSGATLEWNDTYNDKFLSCVVDGASSQVVTEHEKNLLPARSETDWAVETFATSTGEFVYQANRLRYNGYVSVTPSSKYTISVATGYMCNYGVWGSSHNFLSVYGSFAQTITFTTPANGAYLVLVIRRNDNANMGTGEWSTAQPMIEQSETATTYAPFISRPSAAYPSTITSIGDTSGIDLIVDGLTEAQRQTYHSALVLRSLPDGTKDERNLAGTIQRVGITTINAGSSWTITGAEPNSTVMCSHCPLTALSGTTLTIAGGITTTATVLYKLATPIETADPIIPRTYPQYTKATASGASVTASVRVIDRTL